MFKNYRFNMSTDNNDGQRNTPSTRKQWSQSQKISSKLPLVGGLETIPEGTEGRKKWNTKEQKSEVIRSLSTKTAEKTLPVDRSTSASAGKYQDALERRKRLEELQQQKEEKPRFKF
jgi:hypothetical protein